jgi:hypothetical protein
MIKDFEEVKKQIIHIGLSVNFIPGRLRKDYKPFISKKISEKGYNLDEIRLSSD